MALGYYPNQKVTYDGAELKLVQNVNIDFNLKKNVVNEFGNKYAVGYVNLEGPTLNTTIEYAVNSGSAVNLSTFGLDDIESILDEQVGKSCDFSHDGGALSTTNNYIINYSIRGQVGSVPTVSVSMIGLSGSYSVGGTNLPRQSTSTNAVTPQSITVNNYTARSFNCNLNIPRQTFYELGTDLPLGLIVTESPKITVDLELILGANDIDGLSSSIAINAQGSPLFSASNLNVTKYSTKASLNGVAVSNVSLEGVLKSNNCIIYY